MSSAPKASSEVATIFRQHPVAVQRRLEALSAMIHEVATSTKGVGRIEESLKWGQLSFEAVSPKSGTPLRIGVPKTGGVALYAHCQTHVISGARDVFSDSFHFDGNRAVLLPIDADWPEAALRQIIHSALTYRLKPAGSGQSS